MQDARTRSAIAIESGSSGEEGSHDGAETEDLGSGSMAILLRRSYADAASSEASGVDAWPLRADKEPQQVIEAQAKMIADLRSELHTLRNQLGDLGGGGGGGGGGSDRGAVEPPRHTKG